MFACLPILIVAASIVFWCIQKARYNESKGWRNRRINGTIICLIFLFHATLADISFSIFNCHYLNGEYRLLKDLETKCYVQNHFVFALGVALPLILVWVLGSLFYAGYKLYKKRRRLDDQKIRETYGFLFNGYKRKTYYWEIVISVRKLMIVIFSQLIAPIGNQIQAFIMLLFTFFFIMLNIRERPFITHQLNFLDNMSLICCLITIYCGLFFLSETPNTAQFYDHRVNCKEYHCLISL